MPSELIPAPAPAGGPAAGTDVRAELRAWILAKSPDLSPDQLTDHTLLFEGRILRSVHLPELILLLERLSGAQIDLEDLAIGQFRDIDALVANFAGRAGDAEPGS